MVGGIKTIKKKGVVAIFLCSICSLLLFVDVLIYQIRRRENLPFESLFDYHHFFPSLYHVSARDINVSIRVKKKILFSINPIYTTGKKFVSIEQINVSLSKSKNIITKIILEALIRTFFFCLLSFEFGLVFFS